jgi:hypothetical protein
MYRYYGMAHPNDALRVGPQCTHNSGLLKQENVAIKRIRSTTNNNKL